MALREEIIKITVDTKDGIVKINGVTSSLKQAKSEFRAATNAIKGMENGMSQMRNNSGLAGAAVMELGRVASDFNYGIRGIANNLSQFATLFVTLSTNVGGGRNAFLELIKQMRGPLGFLVAIQTGIMFLERFAGQTKKTTEEVDNLNKSLLDQINRLELISGLLDRYGDEGALAADAISLLRMEFKEFDSAFKQLDKNDFKLLIDKDVILEGRDAAVKLKETFLELLKNRTQGNEIQAKLNEKDKETGKLIIGNGQRRIELENKYRQLLRERLKLEEIMKQKGLGDFSEIPTDLELDIDFNEEDALKKLMLIGDKLELNVPLVFDDPEEAIFETRFKFLKKFNKRLGDLSIEDRKEQMKRENEEAVNILNEYYADKLGLEGEDRKRVAQLVSEDIVLQHKYQDELNKINQFFSEKRIGIQKEEVDATKQMNLEAINNFKEMLKSMSDLFSTLAESRRATLEAQIEGIESSTQRQLANENLTEQERYEIRANAEKRKVDLQKQAIKSELRHQQMMLAIKAAELAASINADIIKAKSKIVSESAEAGVSVKAGFGKTLGLGLPKALPMLALYAVQAATIVAGLISAKKQAKQALSSLGTGGVDLGSDPSVSGVSSPTFNVVGSSGVSQIGDIIGSANDKPVKAYVVSEEITNMQQLDQRIVENAGI